MKRTLSPSPLILPMPVVVVATRNEDGGVNAMTASWAAPCAAQPPAIGVAVRPSRKTFANIARTRAFTVHIPASAQAAIVDYLGITSGYDVPDKVVRAGLHETAAAQCEPETPILAEFPVAIPCTVCGSLDISSHTWFAGQMQHILVDSACLTADGAVDETALDALLYRGPAGRYAHAPALLGKAFAIGKSLTAPRDTDGDR